MQTLERASKALLNLATSSLTKPATSNVQRALNDRMTLSEAIEAATVIIGCYPNGGANAGKSYIGAIAATLASYPRSVARRCADRVSGVARGCKFLPTVADVVAWCERETAPLRNEVDREFRIARQLEEREHFERVQHEERLRRLNYDELKAKYGDGKGGWGIANNQRKTAKWLTANELIAIVGEENWKRIPDANRN